MFLQADAAMVARDPGLPGLRLLLDPDAFADALQAARPDLALGAVAFNYVRYKPGTNSLSAFTLDLDGQPVAGYAKAHAPEDWAKLMKASERPGLGSPLGPSRMILADAAIEVVFFPNDNKLKSLSKLFDEAAGKRLLSRLFRDRPKLKEGTLHLLRYKPERRFVARLDVAGEPQASIKLYSPRAYEEARIAAETLHGSAGLIGQSARDGALAFEWRPGTQLIDSISGPTPALTAIERVGAAIANLHRLDVDGLRVRDRESEVQTVQRTVGGLRAILPEATPIVDDLAATLAVELGTAPAVYQPIHGDFYDRQVLVNDGRIEILDLDEAVLADPAADLGLFVAHLERDALSRGLPAEHVAPVRDALLAGYGDAPPRVDLYTAFGLLQLAPHHFRNREPNWPERTVATLERAQQIVADLAVILA